MFIDRSKFCMTSHVNITCIYDIRSIHFSYRNRPKFNTNPYLANDTYTPQFISVIGTGEHLAMNSSRQNKPLFSTKLILFSQNFKTEEVEGHEVSSDADLSSYDLLMTFDDP